MENFATVVVVKCHVVDVCCQDVHLGCTASWGGLLFYIIIIPSLSLSLSLSALPHTQTFKEVRQCREAIHVSCHRGCNAHPLHTIRLHGNAQWHCL